MVGGQAAISLMNHGHRALNRATVIVLLSSAVALAAVTAARTAPRGTPAFDLQVAGLVTGAIGRAPRGEAPLTPGHSTEGELTTTRGGSARDS